MPEYLAPGVYVEEKSFRSKSIEGVSTTTTGFVGACRTGPVTLEPELLTSLADFERVYGGGDQLRFDPQGTLHNYLWHGVRAFFEEGGRRLFVARVFQPLEPADPAKGYQPPANALADDQSPFAGTRGYVVDGHARCRLNKQTAHVDAVAAALGRAGNVVAALDAAAVQARDAVEALTLAEMASTVADDPALVRPRQQAADALAALEQARAAMALRIGAVGTAAQAAKAVFPAATVDVTGTTAALNQVRDELAKALPAVTPPAVIVAAATAVDGATQAARTACTAVGPLVTAALATALSAAAKAFVDPIDTSVKAGGAVATAVQALETAGTAALTKATEHAADAADAPKRKAALDAARTARTQANALTRALDEARRKAAGAVSQAVRDDAARPVVQALEAVRQAIDSALEKVEDARDAAGAAAVPSFFATRQAVLALTALAPALAALGAQVAADQQKVRNDAAAAGSDGAVLLRARFPGRMGNAVVTFALNIGENLLMNTAGVNQAKGLSALETVWVGNKAGAGQLLLALRDAQNKDWCFSTDATAAKAQFWLEQPQPEAPGKPRLDAATQQLRIVTLNVLVQPDGGAERSYTGLSLHPGHRRNGVDTSFAARFAAEPSSATAAREVPLVALADPTTVATGLALYQTLFGAGDTQLELDEARRHRPSHRLAGGNDGQRPPAGDFEGRETDHFKTGLRALADIEDISIIAAPGATFGLGNGYQPDARTITNLLINHAEALRYRVAVLDSGDGQSNGEVLDHRYRYDSTHAALYYPWVKVLDPITREEIVLPPSGFVAGIYARNDIQRAVWKAPANEVVGMALGFERLLNHAQQEMLNPVGINCFRYFEGRGMRLWGARTISSDPEWKYLNVRRYFCYLERSIDRGTQWAVFEPNGEALWDNVRRTISSFLFAEWQAGALLGEKPERAFFVRCDRSTMSQNDLDNGRLICEIGVAPLKPAEFVIFRIGQWTADRKS